ncbi:MAG TPA: LLM class flavin-dependent oxidoreductase [Acidimicrobiales bacterium]|nr:LLM class flavin-dependent oxidoreductase [Acidimicrobiales bacterium]
MRTALSLPNMGDPHRLVEIAVAADANGWDGYFLWDHLHFMRSLDVEVFDPWVVLGAAAVQTARVRLGTMITPVARRRPQKLAKEVVTLDHLSGGRAILGVGLGEPGTDDFAAFGDEGDRHGRAALLDQGLALLDGYLRGEPVLDEAAGVDAHLRPGAVQDPRPPIWVAGKWPNPKPLERAARWDGYLPIGPTGAPATPEMVADLVATLGDTATRPGFDVVVMLDGEHPPADYEAAGATWCAWGAWPFGDWLAEMEALASSPPPN